MPDEKNDIGPILKRELLLAVGLLLAGILLLPAAVYGAGFLIFGEYPNRLAASSRETRRTPAAGQTSSLK